MLSLLEIPTQHGTTGCEAAHTDFFEYANGADVIFKALGRDDVDAWRVEGPANELSRHLGGVAVASIRGDDIVADLDHPRLVWLAMKAHAADGDLVGLVNNNPIPGAAGWFPLHHLYKEGQCLRHIGTGPGVGHRGFQHLRQHGPFFKGSALEL